MSKKNSQNNKLLLDTSFLLPILGFETTPNIMSTFTKLHRYKLFYNDISILEALWKIVKVIRGNPEEIARIIEGINAIKDTFEEAPIDDKTVENAIKMYKLGHRDLIDNLLYSIALSKNMKLLTVDKELVEFIKRNKFSLKHIITPEELE